MTSPRNPRAVRVLHLLIREMPTCILRSGKSHAPPLEENQRRRRNRTAGIMARNSVIVMLSVLSCVLKLGLSQEQVLVQNAQQKNYVDVQFFADTNFQQTRTPFAYFDFPAIQQGSCTQCEDFPVCNIWHSILLLQIRLRMLDEFSLPVEEEPWCSL